MGSIVFSIDKTVFICYINFISIILARKKEKYYEAIFDNAAV